MGDAIFPLPCTIVLFFPFILLLQFHVVQQKKFDVLGMSYQTRSKAHAVIRRMLASLGDPYTRFLTPEEVISC